jgi:hypothetical protein
MKNDLKKFNIQPFALPNTPANEIWFEQPRDITEVVIQLRRQVPKEVGLSYSKKYWPQRRFEQVSDLENPGSFGWQPMDDWFNGEWKPASIRSAQEGNTLTLSFQPLSTENFDGDWSDYDVTFRRSMAIRLDGISADEIDSIAVYTRSPATSTRLRVELDAGQPTPGQSISFETYNATVTAVKALQGVRVEDGFVHIDGGKSRVFELDLDHLAPPNVYVGDAGNITFNLDHESFTIALADLTHLGPVWFADQGVYITLADSPLAFETYRAGQRKKPILEMVKARGDQSFAGAFFGQVRGHSVNFNLGCKHSPQRFRIEPTGDVLLNKGDVTNLDRHPNAEPRYHAKGNAEFFFGLERWIADARFMDPAPALISNLHLHNGDLSCEQRAVCVPVMKSIKEGELTYHEPTAALLRFRFRNTGDTVSQAVLPLYYSECGERFRYTTAEHYRLPSPEQREYTPVTIAEGRVTSIFNGKTALRAAYEGNMTPANDGKRSAWTKSLQPGEACELILKIPFLDLDTEAEQRALAALDFDQACREVTSFWRAEMQTGAVLKTPIPQLNAVHTAHAAYIEFSDNVLESDSRLITTAVGSSTYYNFINESVMIIQELDQRGFTEGVRRRLQLYVEGQGEARQPGNFTDFDGAFYGAKGWEEGDYNQHHGWALWYLAEHYLFTRDDAWFQSVAEAVIKGADWVFRQRKETRRELPHSRGWEWGFLPAGSLEDVTDFYYWLSTNVLTWRGTNAAARALERAGHPEAGRVRKESDLFRQDLIHGLELNRKYAPVVKLRDGRWVPHYPSRLYCRGRDYGWIRQILEGAIYLLISGLYAPNSKQADWILNDYQDNLYHTPPYGYVIRDMEENFWGRGGFSMQPNLLAGLMPHLERDEIEVYLWMFFNAFVSCYREEVNGMVEHPLPELGFDNSAIIKTSDQANSVMWLRYMLVYSTPDLLHFGRAIPRAWLKDGETTSLESVRTHYGEVDACWTSQLADGKLIFEGNLRGPQDAPKTLVRFRHPDQAPIQAITVNGKDWKQFDAERGDVNITGIKGNVKVVASYR